MTVFGVVVPTAEGIFNHGQCVQRHTLCRTHHQPNACFRSGCIWLTSSAAHAGSRYAVNDVSPWSSTPPTYSGGMKIVIPGGTGQVGGILRRALAARGHEVVVLSRHAGALEPGVRHTLAPCGRMGRWPAARDGAR